MPAHRRTPSTLARLPKLTLAISAGLLLSGAVPHSLATIPSTPNPALAEVPLPALAGWNATMVLDNHGVGVWTVEAFPVRP